MPARLTLELLVLQSFTFCTTVARVSFPTRKGVWNSLQMKHTDFSDDASTLARPDTQQSLELKSVISSSLPLYLAVHKSQTRQAGTVA